MKHIIVYQFFRTSSVCTPVYVLQEHSLLHLFRPFMRLVYSLPIYFIDICKIKLNDLTIKAIVYFISNAALLHFTKY